MHEKDRITMTRDNVGRLDDHVPRVRGKLGQLALNMSKHVAFSVVRLRCFAASPSLFWQGTRIDHQFDVRRDAWVSHVREACKIHVAAPTAL